MSLKVILLLYLSLIYRCLILVLNSKKINNQTNFPVKCYLKSNFLETINFKIIQLKSIPYKNVLYILYSYSITTNLILMLNYFDVDAFTMVSKKSGQRTMTKQFQPSSKKRVIFSHIEQAGKNYGGSHNKKAEIRIINGSCLFCLAALPAAGKPTIYRPQSLL